MMWTKHYLFILTLIVLPLSIGGCRAPGLPGRLPGWMPGQRYVPIKDTVPRTPVEIKTKSYGIVSGAKGANIRKGPGTTHTVIGSLSPGAQVTVLDKQNNWYHINAVIGGTSREGWIHGSLLKLNVPATNVAVAQNTPLTKEKPSRKNIVYMGYTKEFLPIKQLLITGNTDQLEAKIGNKAANGEGGMATYWKQDDKLLWDLETGTVFLDINKNEKAIELFSEAERIKEDRESDSHAEDFFNDAESWVGEVFGHGAADTYEGVGYEKVLLLNYLSIAYLLEGERKAYNVARRSIDWQNIEKRAFDARREQASDALQKEDADQGEVQDTSKQAQSGIAAVFDALNSEAKDVPSAFVNPFGFYVTGMIQEYESYQDRSLRDNARISYQKALELNPHSQVLKQAVSDMKKNLPPSGKRLLHVIVADGFAPEKKVLVFNFRYGGIDVPMKIPIYEPGQSQVGRIEVQSMSGRRLAKLSPVADVEALCIRHQKDTEVFRNLKIALAFSSTATEKVFLTRLGRIGKFIGDQHDQLRVPDTRSWMTLPETIQAARVFLPRRTTKVKIVAFSRSGKRLATQVVNLSKDKPNFIYARSIGSTLHAYPAKNLWLAELD